MKRNELGQFEKLYEIDENYFDVIDNEEKAYILGFLYADGCNYKLPDSYNISVTQLEQDKDILDKIKIAMKSTHPLQKIKQDNGKIKYKLSIYSKNLSESLTKLGCIQNKSLVLKFPDFLSNNFLRHFIRGYFDGDGCIWEGKPKIITTKGKERFIHNMKFTFTGCISFIEPLQDYLVKTLGYRKTKLNFSKAKNPNNNTSCQVCTMEYSGKNQIKTLFEYMYKDANIYGNRKYSKFVNILCADSKKLLYETRLTAGNPLES